MANSDAFELAYLKVAQQLKSIREWVADHKSRMLKEQQVP